MSTSVCHVIARALNVEIEVYLMRLYIEYLLPVLTDEIHGLFIFLCDSCVAYPNAEVF